MKRRLIFAISRRRLISRLMFSASIRAMIPAVQCIDHALRQTDRAERDQLVVIIHRHIKEPARVHRPVPACLAGERNTDAAPDLILDLNDQMLEQMGDFRGLRFTAKRKSVVVEAVLGRHLGQQLEQDARDMRAAFGRECFGFQHFDDQRRTAGIVENDFGDFQEFLVRSVCRLLTIAEAAAIISRGFRSLIAQLAERSAVNRNVVGSSPTQGATSSFEPSFPHRLLHL